MNFFRNLTGNKKAQEPIYVQTSEPEYVQTAEPMVMIPQQAAFPSQAPVQSCSGPIFQSTGALETEDIGNDLVLQKRKTETEKAKKITPLMETLVIKTELEEKYRKGSPCHRNRVEMKGSLLELDFKFWLCGRVQSSNEDYKALSPEEQERVIQKVKDTVKIIKERIPESERKICEDDFTSNLGTNKQGFKLRSIEIQFAAGEFSFSAKTEDIDKDHVDEVNSINIFFEELFR